MSTVSNWNVCGICNFAMRPEEAQDIFALHKSSGQHVCMACLVDLDTPSLLRLKKEVDQPRLIDDVLRERFGSQEHGRA